MKIVSVITARGGSEGVPNKNIIDIGGKPLISYSIEASLNSHVDETWVSTDCENISDISFDSGAKVLIRPDEISTGDSQSEEALLHFEVIVANKVVFSVSILAFVVLSDSVIDTTTREEDIFLRLAFTNNAKPVTAIAPKEA